MNNTSTTDRRAEGYSPEEEAILARFLTRAHRAGRRAIEVLDHGSFAVL
jgi:hypothetical protein